MKNQFKILLVDESHFTYYNLCEVLKQSNTAPIIQTAISGEVAEKEINSFHPDLVITEIDLGGKSGIELLKSIKTKHHNSKVMVLTHFTLNRYRKECELNGADYFIDKGTEMDKISGIVEKLTYQFKTAC